MRICLVVHGFPPLERTGVENHTAALARALARAGHDVEVFAPRVLERLPQLSMRREVADGFGITWLTTNRPPRDPAEALDPPGVAERFGEFLDRERPQVVHFQHVIKLGLGLVEEAHRRGLPTVLSAHDYYGICHRYTLMRPDLSRCDTIGDPAACARCDLALSLLNRQAELGDYHMGALADQLAPVAREALASTLAGDLGAAGFSQEEQERALARRRGLDERRAEVFGLFDRILPPSRYLAEQLVRGGLDPERIFVMRLGIETDRLEGVRPPRADPGAPLRFGFVGSLTKHKGVHVLIEAFERLTEPAECLVWGDSTDRVYVRRVREQAARAGVRLLGAFEQDELADCLSQVDVLVVPSLWVENHPLTIREAFAAGRPVIASRCGALPENVRDGVDGLLFEPGDADDLAHVMTRFLREDDLYARLTADLPPPKEISAQVDELVPLYDELVASRAKDDASDDAALPAHLRPVARKHRELDELPSRDLFHRALRGLARLRTGLVEGGACPPMEAEGILSAALSSGSKSQILLSDLQRQDAWLRDTVVAHEHGEKALRDHIRWREEQLAEAEGRAEWHARERGALREERDWLAGLRQGLEEERDWLRSELEGRTGHLEEARAELDRVRSELVHQASVLQELEGEVARISDFEVERKALRERLRTTAELALSALQAQEAVMGQQIGEVVGVLDDYYAERSGTTPDFPAPEVDEMLPAAGRAASSMRRLIEELEWRRGEMSQAFEAAHRQYARVLLKRTGLGRLVRGWESPPPARGTPGANEGGGRA